MINYRHNNNSKKKVSVLLFLFIISISLLISILLFSMNPFQTLSLTTSEATIGENVIGSWQYNGLNSQGQLSFYNGYEPAYIPANSKKFSADGEFVLIISHTPDTLTYESAFDAEIFNKKSIISVISILLFIMILPFWLFISLNKERQKNLILFKGHTKWKKFNKKSPYSKFKPRK